MNEFEEQIDGSLTFGDRLGIISDISTTAKGPCSHSFMERMTPEALSAPPSLFRNVGVLEELRAIHSVLTPHVRSLLFKRRSNPLTTLRE